MPLYRKVARKTASRVIFKRARPCPTDTSGGTPYGRDSRRVPPVLATPGLSQSRSRPAPTESILERPTTLAACSPSEPRNTDLVQEIPELIATTPVDGSSTDEAGTLIRRRRAIENLGTPISTCIEFAMWLEIQTCVEEEALLCAIERDGGDFLRLASATIAFDSALGGNAPPTINGPDSTLVEHAETLWIFAELLKSKISEGSLSEELATAILRDGVSFFRLATNYLEFDRVLRGSGPAQVK